jgi:hypothetical protein
MEQKEITCEEYKKRIVDLCLRSGLKEFPSKRRDQLIILKTIANYFDNIKEYTETEINDIIKEWLAWIRFFPGWDFVMLRRQLIDDGFLTRNPDGSRYWIRPEGPAEVAFDPAVADLDIVSVIDEGKQAIAGRKAAFMQQQAESLSCELPQKNR